MCDDRVPPLHISITRYRCWVFWQAQVRAGESEGECECERDAESADGGGNEGEDEGESENESPLWPTCAREHHKPKNETMLG